MRREDGERAVQEVVSRVVARSLDAGRTALEGTIADTLYHEQKRLEKDRSDARGPGLARLDRLRGRMLAGSDEQRRTILRELTDDFAREVVGKFDPRVHALATRAVPVGLSALLHAMSPRQLLRRFPDLGIQDRLAIDGALDHARALRDLGTIVVVPTHLSNLDSIIMGWGMHEAGFPPLLYGAGLNLFENPLLSYFMANLGAYKVDRKKSAPLYRDVLKEYATVSLEFGYHNLFFPGGTRSRSGMVEKKLKLGLMGTSLQAFANNLRAGKPRPRVFVLPVVLSYELVLEAETLIDDHLRETGKSRYIITDDEFSSPRRILQFMKGILELDARIAFTFMEPLDPFGNRVDLEGRSLDARGRPIEIERYLMNDAGVVTDDPNRDHEYTRELGERIVDAFHRGNTIMPTHLVCFTVFEALRRQNPGVDLYRLLRTGGAADTLQLSTVAREVDRVRGRLVAMEAEGKVRLEARVRRDPADDLVMHALRSLGTYHSRPALQRTGDRLASPDRNLLLYYRNRLDGYGLEGEGGK